jgi:hypothetical protein
MDWNAPLNDYCERLDAGFWAEPVNAVTNLAFIVASMFFIYFLRKERYSFKKGWDFYLLAVLMMAIGVGSFLFHTLASRWSELADIIPIALFINVFLLSFLIRATGRGWLCVGSIFAGYHGLGVLLAAYVPLSVLNGSVVLYGSSYLYLVGICLYLYMQKQRMYRDVLAAVAIWTLSLTLRSLDMQLCEEVPIGTHFWWHILNSMVLYKVAKGLAHHNNNDISNS